MVKAKVEGFDRLITKLNRKVVEAKIAYSMNAKVSYSTDYAVFVHENLEVFHPIGQAKFLESAAREMMNDGSLRNIYTSNRKAGKNHAQASFAAMEALRIKSVARCPVDTGRLRGSAKTTITSSRT